MNFLIDILILLVTLLVLCTPLLLWLYVYQSFPGEFVRRRYVLFGMLLGALMTLPFLIEGIYSFPFILERVFSSLYMGNTFVTLAWLAGIIILFHSLFYLSLLGISYFVELRVKLKYFTGSAFIMILCSSIILLFYLILSFFGLFETSLEDGGKIIFGIVYSSIFSVIGYYLVVSLLEEFSKYVAHLSQSYRSDYTQSFLRFILFSLSLALGFSFFENTLYTWMMYRNNGVSGDLIQVVFFRSLFSLSLHLLCALLFSLGMWYFWKYSQLKNYIGFFRKGYIFLLLGSLATHSFFNLSLNFGYIGVVLLSVFGLYAVVAYIVPRFHDQNAQ